MPNTLQWRNAGSVTRFPFCESGEIVDTDGVHSIPDEFLVDARIFLTAGQSTPYLRYLELSGASITGTFFVDNTAIGSFQATAASIDGSVASIISPDGINIGIVVFGTEASLVFQMLASGVNEFSSEATSIQAACLTTLPDAALYVIKTEDQDCRGKVALAEGAGIELTAEGNIVRIDAVGSTEQNEKCCNSSGTAIKTINGLLPNIYGIFFFNLENFSEPSQDSDLRQVLRMSPDTNGLRLSLAK